jgi:hypothetical protein
MPVLVARTSGAAVLQRAQPGKLQVLMRRQESPNQASLLTLIR